MNALDLKFGVGQVLSVDANHVDANGIVVPVVNVESYMDGGTVAIPLSSAGWEQCQPIPGYKVLYLRFGTQQARIIKVWGNNEAFIRKGDSGLNEGDVVVQSPSGFAYLRLAADGSAQMVSGDMASIIQLDDTGVTVKTPALKLQTYDNLVFALNEDGSVMLQLTDTGGKLVYAFNGTPDGNVSCQGTGDLTLKFKNIFLDGNVFMGPQAGDSAARQKFGNLVTSGPHGTLPTDETTGAPIPGSATVQAAS